MSKKEIEREIEREMEREIEREPEVIIKKKGGWGGKIIALSLGFVIGAGSLVGGVAALGYWALSSPIKKVENTAQNFVPNLDLKQYLTQEYYDGNVLHLIGGIRDVINDISSGEGGFAELAQISPKVKEAVRSLAKNMKKLGSNIEEDAIYDSLLNTPFSSLGGYLSDTLLKSVEVGPMLLGAGAFEFDVLTQDKLMMALLYGAEGEDYVITTETDENGNETKKITLLDGGRKPLSIGEIQGDGVTAVLSHLPVDALLTVNEGDGMMASLAYGPSSHYTYIDKLDKDGQVVQDEEGNPVRVVQMNARVYTSTEGEKFFDEDGNELACTAALLQGATDIYVLTFQDGENNVTDVQYAKLRQSATRSLSAEAKLYDVYQDEACTKPLRYKKTTVTDLMDAPEDLLGTMEIATVMDLNGQGNLNPILAVLAYGEENVDFIWVHKEINGEIEKDENGEPIKYVQLLPGKKPKTIQSLQGDNLDALVTDLPLSSIMNVSTDDAMMMSLAYGSASKYEIKEKQIGVDADDNLIMEKYVEMKQVEYTYKDGAWYDIDENIINAVYDESAGTLTITNEDGKQETVLVEYDETESKCFVIHENGTPVTYKKTTVGDLQNTPSELLDSIELAAVMDITPDSNSIMIALAYGVEGEDYIIEEKATTDQDGNPITEKVITPLPGKKPKTIGDLSGDSMDETISTMPLDVLMEIDLDDGMMTSLAYGSSNKYQIKEKQIGVDQDDNPIMEKYVEMKQVEYTCKDGVWRNIDGDSITAVYDESAGTLTVTPTDGEAETLHVVYDNATQKYLVVDESGKAVTYQKTTVGTLQNEPSSLIDQIELGEVLGVHPEDENSDKLMLALAYGNKGEHYDFDGAGNFYFKEVDGKTYKPRTIGDLRNDNNLFKTIYIGDALEVNSTSHSVLVAIAYGEEGVDFDWGAPQLDEDGNPILVNGQEVREPVMRAGKKPRSIEQLQGSNSDGLINSITLESALGIDANSEAMMRSLAFGQEGVHYEKIEYTEVDGKLVATEEKVTMKHASYTPEFATGSNTIIAFYNRIDEKVTKEAPTPVDGQEGTYKIVLTDDSVQYVKKDANGEYKVYAADGTTEVPYAKTTLGQLSRNSSAVMDGMTLADALSIDENETDGLKRSLAFDKNGNAYTLGQLSDNPQMIIDAMTLADAIGVDANSEAMMRSLAFGQEGVHYDIITEKDADNNDVLVIDMRPAFYTLDDGKMYNRFGEELENYTPLVDDSTYEATVTVDGQLQYLDFVDGRYYVYEADETGTMQPVDFEYTTLQQMSDHSKALMDDITLADALGVQEGETDKLKKSLAYSKDGHAYTIGELSEDPQSIVDNLQLDSVMDPEKDNALTMYLLYGKEGVHYKISEPTPTEYIPEDAPILPDTVDEVNDTAQYIIMLHQKVTVHQKQNHDTLAYMYEEDTNGLYVKDGDSYRLATSTDTGTRYRAVYCVHNEYGESIFEDEDGTLASNHPVLKELSAGEQAAYGNVVIDGYDCTVKFTYTLNDEPHTIYRLLLPKEGQTLADVRVKGYYTYNHYEKAYFLQSAPITDEGDVGEWTSYTYEANTLASFTDAGLMTHLTERLTLEEVLGSTVKDNTILKPIAHTTIDELPGAVDSLTIAQVFEKDVYSDGEQLYFNETNGKWYTTENFQAGTEFERALTGTWKYLLEDATPYEEDANGTHVKVTIDGKEIYQEATPEERADSNVQKYAYAPTKPEEYKVTEIGGLVENMTHNIQNATLTQLYTDGIIVLTDENILNTDIMYEVFSAPVCDEFKDKDGNVKTTLGQLTITEMISYISALIAALSTTP